MAETVTGTIRQAVAILTDRGGSVLPGCPAASAAPPSICCDPHRPRRVGAAGGGGPETGVDARMVAILTDLGGSVLPPHRLTATRGMSLALRSSMTPEGRCCGNM